MRLVAKLIRPVRVICVGVMAPLGTRTVTARRTTTSINTGGETVGESNEASLRHEFVRTCRYEWT